MKVAQAIRFIQITETNKEVRSVSITALRVQASNYTPEQLEQANITKLAVKNFLNYHRGFIKFKKVFIGGVKGLEVHKYSPEQNKLWMTNGSYYRVSGVTSIKEAIRLIYNQSLDAIKL